MHTYLVNSMFKQKIEESLAYTEKLNVAMNELMDFYEISFILLLQLACH